MPEKYMFVPENAIHVPNQSAHTRAHNKSEPVRWISGIPDKKTSEIASQLGKFLPESGVLDPRCGLVCCQAGVGSDSRSDSFCLFFRPRRQVDVERVVARSEPTDRVVRWIPPNRKKELATLPVNSG
jgi:hypothetical protein